MNFLKKENALSKAGVYHYLKISGTQKKRIHLRIDADGHGTLLINANQIFHFNPSAALMAYTILEGLTESQILNQIVKQFRVDRKQAKKDFHHFRQQFDPIISPDTDACPICDLNLEIAMPFSKQPTAPYRMDLAITYQCNNDCPHCYNLRPREINELDANQWKEILDILWNLGIPHVVFTGGEPTLNQDLSELIEYAEMRGFITGLNTNGRALKNKKFVEKLCMAGLDHVQITLESHLAQIHDDLVNSKGAWVDTVSGIQNCLNRNLFVMTNTTLLGKNSIMLEDFLQFLGQIEVPTIGLNGLIHSGRGKDYQGGVHEDELPALLKKAREITTRQNQRLIWYTPTQYCHFDPVLMNLGVKGCTAALYNMCIEPDGSVLPCQSYYSSLGNILEDDWDSIWLHDLAVSIRERKYVAEECSTCPMLQECGGGCPLHQRTQDQVKLELMFETTH